MEDALILAEEKVTLVILNPRVSPVQVQEGLLLGAPHPVNWLRDFADPVGTPCKKNAVGQPDTQAEHQQFVCRVKGVSTDPEKMSAIQDFLIPIELKSLLSLFLAWLFNKGLSPNSWLLSIPCLHSLAKVLPLTGSSCQ